MEKKLFVDGMSCMNCVKRVEKIIGKYEGVSNVSVSLEKKEALFSSDSESVDMEQMIEEIQKFGFTARENA
ncbi:heavy-metal-associated domain-containing protein [Desulfobacterales bacterium HSG16]|nr:heavy-metal-associated domain-containing protein [Desulfobacterales bacterium HSG16]